MPSSGASQRQGGCPAANVLGSWPGITALYRPGAPPGSLGGTCGSRQVWHCAGAYGISVLAQLRPSHCSTAMGPMRGPPSRCRRAPWWLLCRVSCTAWSSTGEYFLPMCPTPPPPPFPPLHHHHLHHSSFMALPGLGLLNPALIPCRGREGLMCIASSKLRLKPWADSPSSSQMWSPAVTAAVGAMAGDPQADPGLSAH